MSGYKFETWQDRKRKQQAEETTRITLEKRRKSKEKEQDEKKRIQKLEECKKLEKSADRHGSIVRSLLLSYGKANNSSGDILSVSESASDASAYDFYHAWHSWSLKKKTISSITRINSASSIATFKEFDTGVSVLLKINDGIDILVDPFRTSCYFEVTVPGTEKERRKFMKYLGSETGLSVREHIDSPPEYKPMQY